MLGHGPVAVAFVGDIHGAWEPMAKKVVDDGWRYFRAHADEVPGLATLYFIPTVNPDGLENGRALLAAAPGTGSKEDAALARWAFNAHDVDLNRNFSVNWSATPCGGERFRLRFGEICRTGNAGPKAFSEPETAALAAFIIDKRIKMALTYHEDQAASVSAKEGGGGIGEPFAIAAGRIYNIPYYASWPKYRITGQAQDWLDEQGVMGAEIEVKYRTLDPPRDLDVMRLAIAWTIEKFS